MEPSRVFVSYSHDTPAHEARVLDFANRLREDGVDAILDQYEMFPPQGWLYWMNRQVEEARFVLAVCTETYALRASGREAPGVGLGATHETRLIQQLLYKAGGVNDKRIVPVLFAEADRAHIPPALEGYAHYVVSSGAGYEELYRLLTDQPKTVKPELGRLRALAAKKAHADYRNAVWNAPPRNPLFTGRERYIREVAERLGQSGHAALSGIGGIGKTQTATEYAHRYRGQYEAALWASAEVDGALASGFAGLAKVLDIPEKDEKELSAVAAGVTRWLGTHSGWLLVLDNIDSVEDLNTVWRLVPAEPTGHVLLTTRLQSTGKVAKPVEVEEMAPEEGALFLLRRAGMAEAASAEDRDVAVAISKEVDGLPLALDQAGAFIEETPSTPAEYLEFYRKEGARLRASRGEIAAEHASVTVTFSLAFARLEKKNAAAADLVRVCAFLAPDEIPEELFLEGGAKLGDRLSAVAGQPLDLAEAVREAGKLALLRRDAKGKCLNLHRQVQAVVRDGMDKGEQKTWAERAAEGLASVFPTPEFRNWGRCEALLPHVRAVAGWVAEFDLITAGADVVLFNGGWYLDDRAEYGEAEGLYTRSLAMSERRLGPESLGTATSLNSLALLYRNQGRYPEAEPLYQRALEIHEKLFGPDDLRTAVVLNNLAVLYRRQRRYTEAEPLCERALHIREEKAGADHTATANSLNNLGVLYNNVGRMTEAGPLFQRALDIRERKLGPDHPDTAVTLHNLAVFHFNQGGAAEAERLFRRALDIREQKVGADHPDTASTLTELASLLCEQGRYEEARPLRERAIAICEKRLGPEHPLTIRARAVALLAQG